MSPLVSICIPAWERPALLLETVRSCLAQTYRDIEVVITDDSRTDRVAAAIEPLLEDGRIRYSYNEERLGQAGNVNHAFGVARGERIVLLHDDNVLFPDAVEILDECWRRNPGLTACYGKYRYVTHSGSVLPRMTRDNNLRSFRSAQYAGAPQDPFWAVLSGQFTADSFMVLASDARATRYRDSRDIGDACDLDFRLRLARRATRFCYVDRLIAQYRMTDTSVSSEMDTVDHAFLIARDFEVPPALEGVKREFLQRRHAFTVRRYIVSGQRPLAWKLLWQSQYWPRGRFTRGHVTDLLLFLCPPALIRALRSVKHAVRARLRRNDAVYGLILKDRRKHAFFSAQRDGTP